jgi:hypothetical protein
MEMMMDLVTLREQFVKLSGRYDLVVDTTDWEDSGADFFIQAGQDYLDRYYATPKATNTIFEKLDTGEWYLTFSKCRVIKEVWINNTEGRSRLTKKDMSWLYQKYSALISETDNGTPLYYCPARLRSTDSTDQIALGAFFNYVKDDSDALRGILIFVPPDEAIVVEIQGLFYSDTLTLDTDESYWSENWPAILIKAALYQVEVFNRNTEGMKDWKLAIEDEFLGLDKDNVEEEVSDINQIEG